MKSTDPNLTKTEQRLSWSALLLTTWVGSSQARMASVVHWLMVLVFVPVNIGCWTPSKGLIYKWLINGADPNHLVTRMILQAPLSASWVKIFFACCLDRQELVEQQNAWDCQEQLITSHLHTCREWYYCILSLPSASQDEQKTSKSGIKDCAGINSSFLDVKLTRTSSPNNEKHNNDNTKKAHKLQVANCLQVPNRSSSFAECLIFPVPHEHLSGSKRGKGFFLGGKSSRIKTSIPHGKLTWSALERVDAFPLRKWGNSPAQHNRIPHPQLGRVRFFVQKKKWMLRLA